MVDVKNVLPFLNPMLCQLGSFDLKIDLSQWKKQPKLDGMRIMAAKIGFEVIMMTRRDRNVAFQFPEIVDALMGIPGDFILDGELTVEGGFKNLRHRNTMNKLNVKIMSKTMPATFNVFDIVMHCDESLVEKNLVERYAVLVENYKLCENQWFKLIDLETPTDVLADFNAYVGEKFEGMVLKRIDSKYERGARSGSWLKFKEQDTFDAWVIGATKTDAAIPFGSLIAVKVDDPLKKVFKIGTGYNRQSRVEIMEVLNEKKGKSGYVMPVEIRADMMIETKPVLVEVKAQSFDRSSVFKRFRCD